MLMNVEDTFLFSDPKSKVAFTACDRKRIRDNDNVHALLEKEFGASITSNHKFANGVNLRREHKLNALSIEYRKVLLKVNGASDDLILDEKENKKLTSCMKQAVLFFYTTETPREILDDLTARAVKLTEASNHDFASRIMCQRRWWQY